jgi:DNA-binding beta-propeller fold protein YncE
MNARVPRLLARHLCLLALSLSPLLGLAADSSAQPPAEAHRISARWTLPGAGGWDYLTADSARHRLFITRGDRVEVVDLQTGTVLGRIPKLAGVHGVALAPDLKRGYSSNGRSNTITEFNYDTLEVLREVPLPGLNPDAILYDPGSHRLFTFNGRSKDATVLDAASLTVLATIPMPDKPEFAATDGKGQVFVNIESAPGQLVVIDTQKLAVKATWTLSGCDEPTGLALDAAHARLFSVCGDNVMAVTDAASGKAVARVAIGKGPDAVAFDGERKRIVVSNGEGTLTYVRAEPADKYVVAATLPTQAGARTLALDPATGRIYTVTATFGPAPAPTAQQPRPRPEMVPDTFTVLVAE